MKINLGHKHKIILECIVLFLVIDAAVLFFKLASNRYSKSVLSYEGNFAASEKLRALNKNAASGKILNPAMLIINSPMRNRKFFLTTTENPVRSAFQSVSA